MAAVRVVALDDADLPWIDVTMPASSSAVRLVRLHADAATGASVSLVRFPPGWTRPGTGHYTCAEEFVAFDGEISVSGSRFAAGAYKYLPSHASRADSFAGEDGCLAVAWFSGPPVWRDGIADDAPGPDRAAAPLGSAPLGSAPLGSVLLGSVAEFSRRLPGDARDAPAGYDAVFLDARAWAYVPEGEPFPDLPGRVLVRRWGRTGG